jgi:glycosyltransferase involved in cell wall biosynthesis
LDNSSEGRRVEDLTLVIPVRDEAGVISQVVREWWDARPCDSRMAIIVVDDASTDGSSQILSELQREIPIRVVRNTQPKGYGESLRVGLRQVQTPWVAFTDGDGQYDPRDLPVLLNVLSEGHDMVIGIRAPRADPFLRKVISHGFRFLMSVFFQMRARDPTVALRAGRTDLVRSVSEQVRYMNGAFLNEFMVRLDRTGFVYAEVPIRHRPRVSGESKNVANWRLPKVSVFQIIALLRLWREFHRLGLSVPASTPASTQIR